MTATYCVPDNVSVLPKQADAWHTNNYAVCITKLQQLDLSVATRHRREVAAAHQSQAWVVGVHPQRLMHRVHNDV